MGLLEGQSRDKVRDGGGRTSGAELEQYQSLSASVGGGFVPSVT